MACTKARGVVVDDGSRIPKGLQQRVDLQSSGGRRGRTHMMNVFVNACMYVIYWNICIFMNEYLCMCIFTGKRREYHDNALLQLAAALAQGQ